MAKGKGKKDHTNTYLLVGGLGVLYLITRPGTASGSSGGGSTPGTDTFTNTTTTLPGTNTTRTILQTVTDSISGGAASTVSGVAAVPYDLTVGTAKKMITNSEQATSDQVFGGQTRTGVSAFLATTKKGQVFTNPVTYKEFIQEQPLAFRAAAGAGNLVTNQDAARYGAYMAGETKKGIAIAGPEKVASFQDRWANAGAGTQALVGLGQAVTVPFGGGGAVGWGSQLGAWLGWK